MRSEKLTKEKSIFLHISIFYATQEWHLLIKNALLPFLIQMDKIYDKHVIWFGKYRGEHIALTIEIKKEQGLYFLQTFDKYFSSFLSKNPSKLSKGNNNFSKMMFDNFPNNSIQYGIQKSFPRLFNRIDNDYINLWHNSSDILLKKFSKFAFSSDDLFTSYMYMIMLLLLIYNINIKDKRLTGVTISNENFNKIYEENKIIIKEILEDCLTIIENKARKELIWLKEWTDITRRFVDQFIANNPNVSISDIIANIKITLQEQLGIGLEKIILLHYFVNEMVHNAKETVK